MGTGAAVHNLGLTQVVDGILRPQDWRGEAASGVLDQSREASLARMRVQGADGKLAPGYEKWFGDGRKWWGALHGVMRLHNPASLLHALCHFNYYSIIATHNYKPNRTNINPT